MTENTGFIMDTSALIQEPTLIHRLKGDIVIPLTVIKQLDWIKQGRGHRAIVARYISGELVELGSMNEVDDGIGDLVKGIQLNTGSTLFVYTKYEELDALANHADNRIVGAAVAWKNEHGGEVVIVTMDKNMRIVALVYGIRTRFQEYLVPVKDTGDNFKNGGNVYGTKRQLH